MVFLRRLIPFLPFLSATHLLGAVDFSHQIVPLLREKCAECHTGTKKKGGLSMNDREALLEGSENGAVVVPGQPAKSKLLDVISSTDPDDQMPPKGDRLTAEQVAQLRTWIEEGAKWEEGFAFQKKAYDPPLKLRPVTLPAPVAGREHPVDRLVDAYLGQHKLPALGTITDAAFQRRVTLDLIGLLPEPAELAKFQDDTRPDKRARLVDALLARDVDYTEHWLTFWNDLLRNDYGGTGFITGGRKQITKWLYSALLGNMPYNQFVKELIAPSPESAGFSEGIKWRGTVSAGQTVEIQFAQSTSQAFLGINMKCASCHDSFIDRWKLSEAYGLAAVVSAKPLELFRCDIAQGKVQPAAWIFPELGKISPEKPVAERQKEMAALMTMPENGRFARTMVNRLWHRMFGRGLVHPVDSMGTPPWSDEILDWLAADFVSHGYDIKHTLALLSKSQTYQAPAQVVKPDSDDKGFVFAGPRAKRLTAEQFTDAVWQLTSAAPTKFDAEVIRRSPKDPVPPADPAVKTNWIWGDSAADNKIPASGETISLRKKFTRPANLQHAAAFMTCDNEFTLYLNGKKIAASDNWEKPQTVSLDAALKNGENELLVVAKNAGSGPNAAGWYFDARFLDKAGKAIHVVSDGTWEWSATLPNAKGNFAKEPPAWKPVVIVPTVGAWKPKVDDVASAELMQQFGSGGRMVRAGLLKSDFLMRTLGRPNRDQIVSLRPNELSTLEAIDLANGSILAGYLKQGAEGLLAKADGKLENLPGYLYRFALSREPSTEEMAALKELLGSTPATESVQDALWGICMLPEFQLVR
jgi:hypothetical protein